MQDNQYSYSITALVIAVFSCVANRLLIVESCFLAFSPYLGYKFQYFKIKCTFSWTLDKWSKINIPRCTTNLPHSSLTVRHVYDNRIKNMAITTTLFNYNISMIFIFILFSISYTIWHYNEQIMHVVILLTCKWNKYHWCANPLRALQRDIILSPVKCLSKYYIHRHWPRSCLIRCFGEGRSQILGIVY